MRRIEVPTNTPTDFELGDTAADIQRRGRRENREGGGGAGGGTETREGEEGEGGSQEGGNSTVTDRGGSSPKKTKN